MVVATQDAPELHSDAWHAERRGRLGASDGPALLGIDPRKSRHTLWLEKTDRIEPDQSGEAAQIGNDLEDGVLHGAERHYGPIERNVRVYADGLDIPLAATLDARILATGEPVNAKTTGQTGPVYGHWGDADSDVIPDSYLVQSLLEQHCVSADVGHIYALIAGRGYVPFRVPYAAAIVDSFLDQARRFWIDHVEADVEPSVDEPPPLEVLKRRHRVAEKIMAPTGEALDEAARIFRDWTTLRTDRLEAEKREQVAYRALVHQMGDAEQLTIEDTGVVTYFETVSHYQAKPAHERKSRTLRIESNLTLGESDDD